MVSRTKKGEYGRVIMPSGRLKSSTNIIRAMP